MDCFGVFNQVSSCQEKQIDFQKAFPSGGRGTAKAVDEVFLKEKTPHPSAFGCHLLPQEKAFYNSP